MLSNVFNYVHNSANSLMVSPLDIDLSSSTHSTSTTATCTNASSQHAGTGFHRRTSNVNIGESASVSVSGSTRHSSKQSSIDKDNDHFINTATHQPIHNTSNIRYGSASSNPVPIIKNDITKLNHFNSSLNQKVTVKASSVTKSFASSSRKFVLYFFILKEQINNLIVKKFRRFALMRYQNFKRLEYLGIWFHFY